MKVGKKARPASKDAKATPPQEEMTHLGVMVNLMLQMDRESRQRVLKYLNDRFDG